MHPRPIVTVCCCCCCCSVARRNRWLPSKCSGGRWMFKPVMLMMLMLMTASLFLMFHFFGLQNTAERGVAVEESAAEFNLFHQNVIKKRFKNADSTIKADGNWLKLKQELEKSPWQQRSKVVVFSYMRGGSTLFSDVFNIDPDSTILWYEALDAFHAHHSGLPFHTNSLRLLYHLNQTRRKWSEEKKNAMVDYLSSLLNCDEEKIPVETLVHRFVLKSSGLSPFAQCIGRFIGPVFRRRQPLLSSVGHMDYGDHFANCPSLRLVSISRLTDFLRRRRKAKDNRRRGLKDEKEEEEKDVFHEYLDQMRDEISRDEFYAACDAMVWRRSSSSSGDSNATDLEDSQLYEAEISVDVERQREFMRNACRERNPLPPPPPFPPLPPPPPPSDALTQCRDIESVFRKIFRLKKYMDSVDAETGRCRETLRLLSASKTLVVAEVHRASFADLEPLIQRMPEVQVVFYARDPRAVSVSRADPNTRQTFVMSSGEWNAVNESLVLCRRMAADIEAKKVLERRYPGSIWMLRYEDFVLDPGARVAELYRWLRRKVPGGLDRWIDGTMSAAGGDDGVYGIHRANGKQRIGKWRSEVNYEEGIAMTKHCIGVLKQLKYNL